MNQTQRNYAISRVIATRNVAFQKLQGDYRVPASYPTVGEIDAALRKGLLPLRRHASEAVTYRGDVGKAYDMSSMFISEHMREGFNEAVKRLDTRMQEVKDEIMLGGAEEAMKLLRAFEREVTGG